MMIPLRRPKFWRSINAISVLLYPISQLVKAYAICKMLCTTKEKIDIPVICIGNITVGGAGKTPLALFLGQQLKERAVKIGYVSRGFGGILSNKHKALKVEAHHSALQVGDEALLLAASGPAYICINRYLAALKAQQDGAQIVIMDDGMQHHSLYKDSTILVVDSEYGFGNKLLLPAGPLRQSVASGMKQCDFIAWIGEKEVDSNFANEVSKKPLSKQCFPLNYYVSPEVVDKLMGSEVVAMCSIASPEKFVRSLEQAGAIVSALYSFPDHHNYTEKELVRILQQAANLLVVTTSKDMVKIPKFLQDKFLVMEIALSDPSGLYDAVINKIAQSNKVN